MSPQVREKLLCYHCGLACSDESISIEDKYFCCHGCRSVYELLSDSNLSTFYKLEEKSGIRPQFEKDNSIYEYLDDEKVIEKVLDFDDKTVSRVRFLLPAIHCSSCVWLLENLYRIDKGISNSKVNFLRREISIQFNRNKISLRRLVELLTSLGYQPELTFENLNKSSLTASNRELYTKIGIAGFAFANVMLFSLPDYLAIEAILPENFQRFFGFLSLFLALPVLFFSASGYFKSAYRALKQKQVNMDLPISLGILTLFLRSSYDIIFLSDSGFIDSFTGLVFFLLLSKLYQKKTYDRLRFDRDYKSYFPMSVTKIKDEKKKSVSLNNLTIGDRIYIRNHELIPTDSVLISDKALIDYSFVTGEALPIGKIKGEKIFAGGRLVGEASEFEVNKPVSQSYLTELWNHSTFEKKKKQSYTNLANRISKVFTLSVISIAVLSALYWLAIDSSLMTQTFTAVLIVACPCALALSTPFTLGSTMRIMGKNNYFIKNIDVIEQMAEIDTVVFDKTGTLTKANASIEYTGRQLTDHEKNILRAVVGNSVHVMSRKIHSWAGEGDHIKLDSFKEEAGKGLVALSNETKLILGEPKWVLSKLKNQAVDSKEYSDFNGSLLAVNNELCGIFKIESNYRSGIQDEIDILKQKYKLAVLSGDNDSERNKLVEMFGNDVELNFYKKPDGKLEYIEKLKELGNKVLMLGDGLNDAGSLAEATLGISVTEDASAFTPACDGILNGKMVSKLSKLFSFSNSSVRIIQMSFVISFLYNIVGIAFAVSGNLSPLVAAVLMPISSLSVVIFATTMTKLQAKRLGLN